MTELAQRQHPEPEALAAFLEGNLTGTELNVTAEHLRDCEECQDLLGEAAAFELEETGCSAIESTIRRPVARWPWVAGLAAAAAITIVVILPSRHPDPLTQLQADHRTWQGRLTAFEYAPLRIMRSAEGESDYRKLSAAAELQERLAKDRSPQNLHRFALAQIALGHTGSAVDLLTEAVKLDPKDARILSDLSAAQLLSGDTAEGGENAARAIELDPSLAPAAFNWALALQELGNRPVAIDAWEKYLVLDPGSPWATEARNHLRRLKKPLANWEKDKQLLRSGADTTTVQRIVENFPQRARYFVQDELLLRWVESRDSGDLALVRAIAQVRADGGDPFLRDVVEHAAARPDEVRAGLQTFATARETAKTRDFDRAARLFDQARTQLEAVRSPLALAATVSGATNDFYRGESLAALDRLTSVENALREGSNYRGIQSERAWVRGLVVGWQGNPNEALASYRNALEYASAGGEKEHVYALETLIAEVFERIGDQIQADAKRAEILPRFESFEPSSQRVYTLYAGIAFGQLRAYRPRLALAFVDAQGRIATTENDPLLLAETESARAVALRDAGHRRSALAAVAAARLIAPGIKTAGLKDRTISDIEYVAGTIETSSNPGRAVASLGLALQTWQRYGWHSRTATGFLARGDALLAAGDRVGAEADFRAGITEMEKQRATLDEPALRVAYFERADRLCNRLIELLIEENRTTEALDVAESERARTLLDQLAGPEGESATPFTAAEIAARVPSSTAIVHFSMLERGAARWTITPGQIAFAISTASRTEIESATERYRMALERRDSRTSKELSRWLFHQLLEPSPAEIPLALTIVVVPDGALHSLPFASLIERDGRYLIENRAIAYAPSATILLRNSHLTHAPKTLLAVAQPFATDRFPPLPFASSEVRSMATLYAHARVMIGTESTPDSFLVEASKADVVHFAGHAVVSYERDSSALLFASKGDEPASLATREVARHHLASHPLVVLAACRTGGGKTRTTEGVASLAASFLLAGARGIVATLWDADDASITRLLHEFHAGAGRGESTAEALRHAQLLMLESESDDDRQPIAWAGVILIGTT